MSQRAVHQAKSDTPKCPHYFEPLRAADLQKDDACAICNTTYFTNNADGNREIPVRLTCGHVYGEACISKWIASNKSCPYRDPLAPIQSQTCSACLRWDRNRGSRSHTVIAVHAHEIFRAFKEKLEERAEDNKKLFGIAAGAKAKLLAEVQRKLKEYDRQFHPPAAFARMMDPMLSAFDRAKVRREFGKGLFKPVPYAGPSKRLTWSVDVIENGDLDSGRAIPWITQCIREWATEMLEEFSHEGHDHIQEGYEIGGSSGDVIWAVRDIVGHRRNGKDTVTYKVRWEGHEHWDEPEEKRWVPEEDFANHAMHRHYDEAHGLPPYRRGVDDGLCKGWFQQRALPEIRL
ncbi:uncharacterized protein BDZ99DRAFT_524418 [Mytilinidion resinicola]|uniref:RING-type domain-containing protein n=1 Tax=Mytilinidion resinicola TaxID=574789 RepID=A0A6A6Y9F7_9PEZI|nr:uncharacterized protein BDZ99DRAFT_524418 [Mytilinidion resinicola]KAF2805446.1 hypothetical protein BDZ99DRAFT_524418 [Mytilinidion resinicola]